MNSQFNRTGFSTARRKPNDSCGLENRYDSLVKSCSQNAIKSETFRELTKTNYQSNYWRNWNATRPEISVKIEKLGNLNYDYINKERNFKLHFEENQGRNFDEDYFVAEVKSEIENLDRWYYDNKHFLGNNPR